jgi:hypothetical protein
MCSAVTFLMTDVNLYLLRLLGLELFQQPQLFRSLFRALRETLHLRRKTSQRLLPNPIQPVA